MTMALPPLIQLRPSRASTRPLVCSPSSLQPPLRCVAHHRDVQFLIMRMLTLKELAALDSTCRIWRCWIERPPRISELQFVKTAPAPQITPLTSCKWARRLVTTVHLQVWCEHGSRFLLREIATAESELAVCDILSALPQLTRLHTLSMGMIKAFATTSLWPTCFLALSGSLCDLQLGGRGIHPSLITPRWSTPLWRTSPDFVPLGQPPSKGSLAKGPPAKGPSCERFGGPRRRR
jgi:hypothetical protein